MGPRAHRDAARLVLPVLDLAVFTQPERKERSALRALWDGRVLEASNPGVFLFAAFLTFYVLDYFVFERVQLWAEYRARVKWRIIPGVY